MKMNKKGFTLIEMLVVIAIIAILVAIVIPTVSTSTKKAAYAADAANLRSTLAEAEIMYLNNQDADGKAITTGGGTEQDYSKLATWTVKGSDYGKDAKVEIKVTAAGKWTATIGGYTIENIATGAETGTLGTKK